jgi:hypothetical protein
MILPRDAYASNPSTFLIAQGRKTSLFDATVLSASELGEVFELRNQPMPLL